MPTPSEASPAIRVSSVSKRYVLGSALGPSRITEALASLRTRRHESSLDQRQLIALDKVSFDVEVGEVVGIVGHNGAGKSTLLKIISRITAPDEGVVTLRGRVGSLLEVGTGFHAELTGRENVFLNGAILGMRRAEIALRLDEILAFAEVERFADTPVKRYSSGMYMRLAFAVAAHLEPEIMLVDEVLSVGDAAFQAKSLGKMSDLASSGRTVLYVSHNVGSMARLCSRCVWLEHGRLRGDGDARTVINDYLAEINPDASAVVFSDQPELAAQFHSLSASVESRADASQLTSEDAIRLTVEIDKRIPVPGLHFSVALQSGDGTLVLHTDVGDEMPGVVESLPRGRHRFIVELPPHLLAPGQYVVTIGMAGGYEGMIDRQSRVLAFTIVDTSSTYSKDRPGLIGLPMAWHYEGTE